MTTTASRTASRNFTDQSHFHPVFALDRGNLSVELSTEQGRLDLFKDEDASFTIVHSLRGYEIDFDYDQALAIRQLLGSPTAFMIGGRLSSVGGRSCFEITLRGVTVRVSPCGLTTIFADPDKPVLIHGLQELMTFLDMLCEIFDLICLRDWPAEDPVSVVRALDLISTNSYDMEMARELFQSLYGYAGVIHGPQNRTPNRYMEFLAADVLALFPVLPFH